MKRYSIYIPWQFREIWKNSCRTCPQFSTRTFLKLETCQTTLCWLSKIHSIFCTEGKLWSHLCAGFEMDVCTSAQLDPCGLLKWEHTVEEKHLVCLDAYLSKPDNCSQQGGEAWGSTGRGWRKMHLSPVYPLWTGEVTLDSAQENHKDWYAKIPRQLLFVPNGRKTLDKSLTPMSPHR